MKALFTQHLNEIVGLTIMVLMAVALIAGQADASARQGAGEEYRAIVEARLTIED